MAGDETNEAIMRYMHKKYQLLIGENTAETTKFAVGNAFPQKEPQYCEIRGKDVVSGKPKVLAVTDADIREALAEPVQVIVDAVRRALEKTPPELSADILDSGITLAGGGALLKGLDELIAQETQLKVHLADDPLTTVAEGTGIALEEISKYRKVFVN